MARKLGPEHRVRRVRRVRVGPAQLLDFTIYNRRIAVAHALSGAFLTMKRTS
ncbi:hypothetical protein [Candidatus Methylomirabilis sp.]|uniref:hypothetical protein n=1 Tax=Candidatus Methylomirabilis sp. TaxID=2032687 RepID=UPI003C786E30